MKKDCIYVIYEWNLGSHYNNYTNKSNNLNPIIYTNTNYYTINRNIIAMEIVIGKMNGLWDDLNNPNKKPKSQV